MEFPISWRWPESAWDVRTLTSHIDGWLDIYFNSHSSPTFFYFFSLFEALITIHAIVFRRKNASNLVLYVQILFNIWLIPLKMVRNFTWCWNLCWIYDSSKFSNTNIYHLHWFYPLSFNNRMRTEERISKDRVVTNTMHYYNNYEVHKIMAITSTWLGDSRIGSELTSVQ